MWSSILAWIKQPYNSQGTAFNWVLFVGLIIIAVWLWNSVVIKFSGEI